MGEKININNIILGETEEITQFGRLRHNISCKVVVNVGETSRKNVE
jgi:hypothetical protein